MLTAQKHQNWSHHRRLRSTHCFAREFTICRAHITACVYVMLLLPPIIYWWKREGPGIWQWTTLVLKYEKDQTASDRGGAAATGQLPSYTQITFQSSQKYLITRLGHQCLLKTLKYLPLLFNFIIHSSFTVSLQHDASTPNYNQYLPNLICKRQICSFPIHFDTLMTLNLTIK